MDSTRTVNEKRGRSNRTIVQAAQADHRVANGSGHRFGIEWGVEFGSRRGVHELAQVNAEDTSQLGSRRSRMSHTLSAVSHANTPTPAPAPINRD